MSEQNIILTKEAYEFFLNLYNQIDDDEFMKNIFLNLSFDGIPAAVFLKKLEEESENGICNIENSKN